MPDIASVNAGEVATLSDLCGLIENATDEERARLGDLFMALPVTVIPGPRSITSELRRVTEEAKDARA
jgi:hypothetical protein